LRKETQVQQATVTFTDPTGLHARPAAVLVQTAGRYQAEVSLYLEGSDRFASARSIMQLLRLGVQQGDRVKIVAEGDDATEALNAILKTLPGEIVS
jgi:phosphocarrier protein